MTTNSTIDRRAEYIAGLRQLADLLETTPDLPLPVEEHFSWNVWPHTTPCVKDEVARIVRLLPGPFAKNAPTGGNYDSKYFTLTGALHGLGIEVATYREQVCRRVVTGTETVALPPVEAQPARTETREVVDWVCEPVLADAIRA